MPNYNESKIYKICCRDTSIEEIYIGSTINFKNRKCRHKSACNKLNNLKIYQFIRDNGGWENWDMVLIEEVKVNSKLELHKKEREFIELLKPSLNSSIPTRTKKEYQEDNKETIKEQTKEYREKNKEKRKEKRKEYYHTNKKLINDNKKEKYQTNKETIKEKTKAYRENNKEFISEKRKEKITCECGSSFRKADKAQHNKTKKHIDYVN